MFQYSSRHARPLVFCLALSALLSPALHAQETRTGATFRTPNTTTGTTPVTVTFRSQDFVNQGLVGYGTFTSSARDTFGDTLGSFSSMALDLTNWRRSGSGYAGGVLLGLPDRGYNTDTFFSDYAARVHRFGIALTPAPGTGAAPANSLALSYLGSVKLADNQGRDFTGNDPGPGTTTALGVTLPSPTGAALGAGRISIDAEGIAYLRDGSFFVSDEYSASVFYFDAQRRLQGVIAPPPALVPRTGGVIDFNSLNPPTTGGRRNNQGMEGMSVSPDGSRLFVLLQSGAVQDTTTNQATRQNTRLLVYDISTARTPTSPIGHYVLQLPNLTLNGAGGAPDRTAAQSELLALNSTQFLVLSRDGNGRGNGTTNPFVYKSVLLVDTSGATNLAGTAFETSYQPLAPGGVLNSSITPVLQAQFINILNTTQLGRFGVSLGNTLSDASRLSEKWESLGLAPALDASAPTDYFLFVGNDNDFQTQAGSMQGRTFDAGLENANAVLVYRVTLPTYVPAFYLDALKTLGPQVVATLQRAASHGALAQREALRDFLTTEAALADEGFGDDGIRGHVAVGGDRLENDAGNFIGANVTVEAPLSGNSRAGLSFVARGGDGEFGAVGRYDYRSYALGLHVRTRMNDWVGTLAAGYSRDDYSKIRRPEPFGMPVTGSTEAHTFTASAELARPFASSAGQFRPFLGADWFSSHIDAYTESGAAAGDIAYPAVTASGVLLRAGLGWSTTPAAGGAWIPAARIEWSEPQGQREQLMPLSLARIAHSDATANVIVPGTLQPAVLGQLSLTRTTAGGSAFSIGAGTRLESGAGGLDSYRLWVGYTF